MLISSTASLCVTTLFALYTDFRGLLYLRYGMAVFVCFICALLLLLNLALVSILTLQNTLIMVN